jgi:uncharacterized membrane protein YkvA (DUF1232 family)
MASRWRTIRETFRRELAVYRKVMADKRTPRLAKLLLGAAVAYALSPVDLVPDFIPVIGHLDDAVIVPALILAALALIPKELVESYREEERRRLEAADSPTETCQSDS